MTYLNLVKPLIPLFVALGKPSTWEPGKQKHISSEKTVEDTSSKGLHEQQKQNKTKKKFTYKYLE